MPTKTDLDSYECHHGIGYSIFKGSKNDLAAELTDFVPIGSTCEINKLTMTNHSKEEKHFSIFFLCRVLSLECNGRYDKLPA